MNVTIIGAGNGGQAVAGALGLAGHSVRLYDIDQNAVAPIAIQGGIELSGPVIAGFGPVAYAGLDLEQALEGAELTMIIVPGIAHADAVASLARRLADDSLLLLHPGCTGGALEAARVLAETGTDAVVAEADSFLYGCRLLAPGSVAISAVKAEIRIAALPPEQTDRLVAATQTLFPQAKAASSVLETSLANMNAVLHVAPMLANSGRIEQPEREFEFYGEGITPSVARLVERVDGERLALAETLGVPARSVGDWILETYGVRGPSLYEMIQTLNRDVYRTSPAPRSLGHRYLTEDVAVGFVPLEALGHAAHLEMALTGALVTIASAATGRDFRREGRGREALGLARDGVDHLSRLTQGRRYAVADQ